jgi:hypothetical protein
MAFLQLFDPKTNQFVSVNENAPEAMKGLTQAPDWAVNSIQYDYSKTGDGNPAHGMVNAPRLMSDAERQSMFRTTPTAAGIAPYSGNGGGGVGGVTGGGITGGGVSGGTGTPTGGYQQPDYKKQVSDIYSPLLASNLADLKAAYDKARGNINSQRPQVTQAANSARASNTADYYSQLPELYRAMEASGQRGGENVTGMLSLGATRGRNLGQINQTEQNNLATLQNALTQLDLEQPQKETSIRSQLASEEARALMTAQQSGIDNAMKMAGLTGKIDVSPGVSVPTLEAQQINTANTRNAANDKIAADERAKKDEETALNKQIETIGMYGNDYDAEIRRRLGMSQDDSIPYDLSKNTDPLVPYLIAARNQKVGSIAQAQKAAEDKAAVAKSAGEKAQFDAAMKVWESLGVASGWVAEAIGLPEGAQTDSYNLNRIKAANEVNKTANDAAKIAADAAKVPESKPDLSFKDYLDLGYKYKSAKGEDGHIVYTDNALIEWIKGLPITNEQKANLANSLSISTSTASNGVAYPSLNPDDYNNWGR